MGNKFNVGEVHLNTSNNLYYKVVDVADTGHVTFFTYLDKSLSEGATRTVWSPFDLDAESRFFELVEVSPKFNVGDTVYLLEGAHGGDGTIGYTPEKFIGLLDDYGLAFGVPWTVYSVADPDGDVHIVQDNSSVIVLEKFLTKEQPVPEQCAPVTFEAIKRIASEVGHLFSGEPTEEDKPETVEVEKLHEAVELLGLEHIVPLERIIKLAQRLK